MMTGVALDHEDKLDDILKGLEDLNRSQSLKSKERKERKAAKNKQEDEEDDVFDNTVNFVTKAAKWKGRASTSQLEKERAAVSTKKASSKSTSSSFKSAVKMNSAANAFGGGAKKKTSPHQSSGSFSDDKPVKKLGRSGSEKAKKSYKTAENKDGTMTRTFSQKYKA